MLRWEKTDSFLINNVTQAEAFLLKSLATNVHDIINIHKNDISEDELSNITGLIPGHNQISKDIRLARLFPDFIKNPVDIEEKNEVNILRVINEPDLIQDKLESLDIMLKTIPEEGGEINISNKEAHQWLKGLNDLRLVIGTSIEDKNSKIVEEEAEELRDIYDWLTFMQDSLIDAMII